MAHRWRSPVTVAVDNIDGLDVFVEFEYTGQADSIDSAISALDWFVASLDVPLGERVHRGYPHMFLGRDH